jgi:hypothetical protein
MAFVNSVACCFNQGEKTTTPPSPATNRHDAHVARRRCAGMEDEFVQPGKEIFATFALSKEF